MRASELIEILQKTDGHSTVVIVANNGSECVDFSVEIKGIGAMSDVLIHPEMPMWCPSDEVTL